MSGFRQITDMTADLAGELTAIASGGSPIFRSVTAYNKTAYDQLRTIFASCKYPGAVIVPGATKYGADARDNAYDRVTTYTVFVLSNFTQTPAGGLSSIYPMLELVAAHFAATQTSGIVIHGVEWFLEDFNPIDSSNETGVASWDGGRVGLVAKDCYNQDHT